MLMSDAGNFPKEASIRVPTWPTRSFTALVMISTGTVLAPFRALPCLGKVNSVSAVDCVFLGAS